MGFIILSKLKYSMKQINNYTLIEKVGEGNYGEVFRAIHSTKLGEFAVKVISLDKFEENVLLAQCTNNQAKILTAIGSSEFIVKYQQRFQTRNNYYVVYQYCNGGNLSQAIKRQKHFSQKKALSIFRQLLQAFKVLNRFNVMHRDIKPQNIFFSDGKVKLGDFGFCKGLEAGEYMAKTMLGSPIYMAPEVLKGEKYTIKADIWSLGVVLYEMLFGVCPYQSNSIAMLITTIGKSDIAIPLEVNSISQETQNLLKKMLTKDYFRRINWVELFHYKIDEYGNYVDCNIPKSPYSKSNKSISNQRSQDRSNRLNMSFQSTYNEIFGKEPLGTENSFQSQKGISSNKYIRTTNYQNHTANKAVDRKVSFFQGDYDDKYNDSSFDAKYYSSQRRIQINFQPTSDNIAFKRDKLLSKHRECIDSLHQSLQALQSRQAEAIVKAYITLKKVQAKLREIGQCIMISETNLLDIASLVNYEIIQVGRQLTQTQNELKKRKMQVPKASLFMDRKSFESEIIAPQVSSFNSSLSYQ